MTQAFALWREKSSVGGRGGGSRLRLVSGDFYWVPDLGESVWVEHLLFDTRRTKKRSDVLDGRQPFSQFGPNRDTCGTPPPAAYFQYFFGEPIFRGSRPPQ